MLQVDEITADAEFAGLAPAWNSVMLASPLPSFYLTHEWLTSWWSCNQAPDKKLRVLVARNDRDIVGLAPLMRVTRRYLGIPLRSLEFLSMSMYPDHPAAVAGHVDWIVRCNERDVIACFYDRLQSDAASWQVLRLHPVPARSPLLPLNILETTRRGWNAYVRPVLENAYISCNQSWDQYYQSLSGDFRRTLRRTARELAALGTVEFSEIRSGDADMLYDRMLRIERQSWKWTRGISLNSVAYKGLFKSVTSVAARNGWLRLWILTHKDRDIAYELCVAFGGELHCLKKSYDAAYAHYFPGGQLERHIYEQAFTTGITRIHTLWGDETHKRKWNSATESFCQLLVFHPGTHSRLARGLLHEGGAADIHRHAADVVKRAMRWVGVSSPHSELTRTDQL